MNHRQTNQVSDRMTQVRYSYEEPAPAWVKSFYAFFCPCLMKDTLIQQRENTKAIIIQKNSSAAGDSIYDKQIQMQYSDKPMRKLRKQSQSCQRYPNLQTRQRTNSMTKSTTAMTNSKMNQTSRKIKRANTQKQVFSILQYQMDKIVEIGNNYGKMLCIVKSQRIQPSASSTKKLQHSVQRVRKPQLYCTYIDQFWDQRYYIFEKFDEGVKIHSQSWFTEIPEAVADYIASKVRCQVLLDGFAGSGSASIKFGNTCQKVFSNDKNYDKLDCLVTNSKIYGCQNIEISNQDFVSVSGIKPDVVFLIPPYNYQQIISPENINPQDFKPHLRQIFAKAVSLSHNLILLFPPNIEIQQILGELCTSFRKADYNLNTCSVKIQKILFMGKLKYILIYVGALVQDEIKISDQLNYVYNLLKDKDQQHFQHKRLIRNIRQKYGMLDLLNFTLQSLNLNTNKEHIQNFQQYLLQNGFITKDELQRLKFLDEQEMLRIRKKTESSISEQEKVNQIFQTRTERTQSEYSNYQMSPSPPANSGSDSQRQSGSLKRNSDFISIQIDRQNTPGQNFSYQKKNTLQLDPLDLDYKQQEEKNEELKNSQSVRTLKKTDHDLSLISQQIDDGLKPSQSQRNFHQ